MVVLVGTHLYSTRGWKEKAAAGLPRMVYILTCWPHLLGGNVGPTKLLLSQRPFDCFSRVPIAVVGDSACGKPCPQGSAPIFHTAQLRESSGASQVQ